MYNYKSRLLLIVLSTGLLTGLPACKKVARTSPTKKEKTKQETTNSAFSGRIERLNFEDATKAYNYYKANNQVPQVVKSIERMIALSTDHEVINKLIIELADIKFKLEAFAEAEALYMRHSLIYPGSPNIDYIVSQHIESAFRQILDPARDQTKTKATIELSKKFLERFKPSNRYYQRIKSIEQECQYLLLTSELNNIDFYLQKHTVTGLPAPLKAVRQRIIHIKKNILPHIDNKQAHRIAQEIEAQLEEPEDLKLAPELLTPIVEKIRLLISEFHGKPAPTEKKARDRF